MKADVEVVTGRARTSLAPRRRPLTSAQASWSSCAAHEIDFTFGHDLALDDDIMALKFTMLRETNGAALAHVTRGAVREFRPLAPPLVNSLQHAGGTGRQIHHP